MNDAMPCVSNIYYKFLLSTDLACFNSAVEAIKHCKKKKTFNSGDLYVCFLFVQNIDFLNLTVRKGFPSSNQLGYQSPFNFPNQSSSKSFQF